MIDLDESEIDVLEETLKQALTILGRYKKRLNAYSTHEKMKTKGTKPGRKRVGDYKSIRKLRSKGFTIRHIAKLENVSTMTVQRAINENNYLPWWKRDLDSPTLIAGVKIQRFECDAIMGRFLGVDLQYNEGGIVVEAVEIIRDGIIKITLSENPKEDLRFRAAQYDENKKIGNLIIKGLI